MHTYNEQPYGCGNCLKTFKNKGQIVSHYSMCCQQKKKPCRNNTWSDDVLEAMFDGRCVGEENAGYCKDENAAKRFRKRRQWTAHQDNDADCHDGGFVEAIMMDKTVNKECLYKEVNSLIAGGLGTVAMTTRKQPIRRLRGLKKKRGDVNSHGFVTRNTTSQIKTSDMELCKEKCLTIDQSKINSRENTKHRIAEWLADRMRKSKEKANTNKASSPRPSGETLAKETLCEDKSFNCIQDIVYCLHAKTVDNTFQPCKKLVRDRLHQCLLVRQLDNNAQSLHDGISGNRTKRIECQEREDLNVMTETSCNILEKENCNDEDLMVQNARTQFLNGRVTDDLKVKKGGRKLCRRKRSYRTRSSEVLVAEHLDDETFRDMIAQDLSNSKHGVTSCTGVETVGNYCRPCKKDVRDQLHQLLMSRKLDNSFQYTQDILADTASLQLQNCNQERECWKVEDLSSQTCTETGTADPTVGDSSCSEKLQNHTDKLEQLDNLNMSTENHFYKTVDNCKKSVCDERFSQPDKGVQEVKCLPTPEFNSDNYEIDKEDFSEKSCQDSERTVGEFSSVKLEKRSPSMECLPMKDIISATDIKEEEVDTNQANWEHSFCLENLVCKTENSIEHFDTITLEERVTDTLHSSDQSAGKLCCLKPETVDDQFQPCKKPVRDQLHQFLMARRLGDQVQHVHAESKDQTDMQTENSDQETKFFQTDDFYCETSERISLAEFSSCPTDINIFCSLLMKKEVEEMNESQPNYANYENCKTEITKDYEKSARDDIDIDYTLQSNWSGEIQCLNAADLDNETDAKELIAKVLVTTDDRSENFCSSVTEKLDNQTGPCTHAVRDQLRHLLMSRFAKKTNHQLELENCGYMQENWSPTVLMRNNVC